MNRTTQQTDSRHPRPNPRFAGVERILVVGVENLAQGITDKNIGLIVTGLLIILPAVGLWVVFHHSTKIRLWCYRCRRPAPSSLEDAEELVEIGAPPVSGLPVSVQPIQTYIWDASLLRPTLHNWQGKIWNIRVNLWYCMLVNNIYQFKSCR